MMAMENEARFTRQRGYPRHAVDAFSLSPSAIARGSLEIVVVVLIQTSKVSTPLTAKCLAGISRFG
jgi:hypothetical protein